MLVKNEKLLGKLLLVSLFIILIQVMIGGITRLTGSGLSMTDWNLIMGVFPPISQADWLTEFAQYKNSPQYLKLNEGMQLSEFKFIYFWEWFHRVWGRIGFLFLLGILAFFTFTKKLDKTNFLRFGILLFLYLCQGLLGWWMVKSGLINNPYVSHYRLASHLLLAIVLFSYILWWAVQLLVNKNERVEANGFKSFAWFSIALIVLQIVFGAFMSGLKIAGRYPSWPDMNGSFIPETIFSIEPFYRNFLENPATIQFTHRGLAYILLVVLIAYFVKARKLNGFKTFTKTLNVLPIVLVVQILLGILTVITASGDKVSIGLGAAHQVTGLILLSTVLFLNFQLKKNN
ncbi:UNVERIFIED_CONTAM: hypothetical protein GTU68_043704 [Idotea baltica]|nr:hypothetical protein [Idotea baltica]